MLLRIVGRVVGSRRYAHRVATVDHGLWAGRTVAVVFAETTRGDE